MDAAVDIEALVPYRDGAAANGHHHHQDARAELEKKRGESYRQALEEHTEVAQQLTLRNRQLKEIIDKMRNIVWEINTMLAMRQT